MYINVCMYTIYKYILYVFTYKYVNVYTCTYMYVCILYINIYIYTYMFVCFAYVCINTLASPPTFLLRDFFGTRCAARRQTAFQASPTYPQHSRHAAQAIHQAVRPDGPPTTHV